MNKILLNITVLTKGLKIQAAADNLAVPSSIPICCLNKKNKKNKNISIMALVGCIVSFIDIIKKKF